MAKKITRKQLLKEPDEFLTFSQKTMGYVLKYKIQFLAGLGILFSILIIVSLVQYFSVQSENKAFALLSQGTERYNKMVEEKDPETAFGEVEKDFQDILDQYAGKDGGKMATVAFANMAYDAGKYDRAITLYQKALGYFSATPSVKNLILSGLGHSHEDKKDYPNAAGYFEQIASGSGSLMKEEAFFRLGIIYERMGDKEKSRKAYEKFLTAYPDSSYAELVKEEKGISLEKS